MEKVQGKFVTKLCLPSEGTDEQAGRRLAYDGDDASVAESDREIGLGGRAAFAASMFRRLADSANLHKESASFNSRQGSDCKAPDDSRRKLYGGGAVGPVAFLELAA